MGGNCVRIFLLVFDFKIGRYFGYNRRKLECLRKVNNDARLILPQYLLKIIYK